MLRVFELDELFDAVATLASGLEVAGDRLAMLTNGGGLGVLATDRLVVEGGRLAQLSEATRARLDATLPPTWSHGNPVDIIGDAGPDRYATALAILLEDPETDAVMVINCPTAVADSAAAAEAVIATAKARRRPLLTSWLGETAAEAPRRLFNRARIPTYATPDKAVHAFMHAVRYRRNQAMLMQTPPSVPELFAVDEAAVRRIVEAAIGQGRTWLGGPEATAVLRAYGVPTVTTRSVKSAEEAARAAAELGRPVALKILSRDILHKTEVGGVALNLLSPERVRAAGEEMLAHVRSARPDACIDGLTVQEMAPLAEATELIVGVVDDALFGPVILFGHGGTAVEVIQDKALGLPPLNLHLAREMIARTRVSALLHGYRAKPAADIDAIAVTLMKVAQLASDIPEIVELDINPLLARESGVLALDARVRVARQAAPGARRLAISPYPKQLEARRRARDGMEVLVRPIRPEDEPLLQVMIERSTPKDVRFRFFAPLRHLSPPLAARLTQIDYDREMAFAALAPAEGRPDAMLGVARLAADPDNSEAEYAVFVRSDMKGRGLGWLLMRELIEYGRARGIGALTGKVLQENETMLQMCRKLGFTRHQDPGDPSLVNVRLKLTQGLSDQGA
jgi:acetyltransferase